ncbi:hypothetical protein [Roseiflexus sp.]
MSPLQKGYVTAEAQRSQRKTLSRVTPTYAALCIWFAFKALCAPGVSAVRVCSAVDLRSPRAARGADMGNELVGTAVIAVEITAYDVIEGAAPAPVRPPAFGKNVEPPDVVLYIAVEESPPSLLFSLIRDGGAWWKTFPTVRIRQLPETFAAGLYRSIASLAGSDDPVVKAVLGRRLSIPPNDVDRSVKNLGRNLWKSLIPDDLKALYAAERDDWAGKTLLILSDEPHLPWERSGSTMTAVGGATSSPGAAL